MQKFKMANEDVIAQDTKPVPLTLQQVLECVKDLNGKIVVNCKNKRGVTVSFKDAWKSNGVLKLYAASSQDVRRRNWIGVDSLRGCADMTEIIVDVPGVLETKHVIICDIETEPEGETIVVLGLDW